MAHIGRSGLQANWSADWGSAAFSGTSRTHESRRRRPRAFTRT
jgi:hypothetical protein